MLFILMNLFRSIVSSDPYVVLKLNGKNIYKSKTIMKNLNPIFNEALTVIMNNPSTDVLEFEVWDYDFVPPDDFMGKGIIPIENLPRYEISDKWYSIGKQGTVCVCVFA